MGERLHIAKQRYNINDGSADNCVLFLILNIIGLGIVTNILIQLDLNKFAAKVA